MRKFLLAILSFFCVTLSAETLELTAADSIDASAALGAPTQDVRLSLITCQPGDPMYSKYGHTAIHLVDSAYNIDYIFNYGVFDFLVPMFPLRFALGQTDYQLDVEPTWFFYETCFMVGRYNIYEQPLNLTYEQNCAIIYALLENLRDENKFYRYNFVFKNCSTQALHIILRHLDDTLLTPEFDKRQDTFRDLINYYSGKYQWGRYAINIAFGREADRVMRPRERLFLPEQLMNYFSEARFASTGEKLAEDQYVDTFRPDNGTFLFSPLFFELLIAVLCLVMTVIDLRRRKSSWWLDSALLFLLGLSGIIVWFISLFSSHPLVGENINMLWLNPLLLVPAILLCIRKTRDILTAKTASVIGIVLIVVSFVVIALWGQGEPFIIIPAALSVHLIATATARIRRSRTTSNLTSEASHHTTKASRTRLLLALLLPLATLSAQQPRLTVVALVDGMSGQAMKDLRDYWQAGGLRRLSEEAFHADLHFSQLCYGGAEMTATLLSGTYPDEHGIASEHYFQRQDRTVHYIFEDKQENGIGTDLHLSTRNLRTITAADELRLRYGADAKIYAIGLTPGNTLPLAGHSANACCWLDEKTQQWVSTTYYSEGLPTAADKANINGSISSKADAVWTPRLNVDTYLTPTAYERKHNGFSYNMREVLHHSPAANTLVTNLALELQKSEHLGADRTPDMLLLEYTVRSPHATSDNLQSAEQEDMYLTLNQDIGYLIEQLSMRIGAENLTFILVGKPSLGSSEQQMLDANLEVTHFDINRASALLSTYLMAVYGHERWIDGGHEQHIFLNRTLIEQKGMSVSDFEQQVAHFLMEFDGVADAYPTPHLPLLRSSDRIARLQHSCYKRTAGDVIIMLEDNTLLFNSDKQTDHIIDSDVTAPLFILTGTRTPHPTLRGDATELKSLIVK